VAELLHRVETEHSLRAAAGAMEMAYSKAWRIVRTAEEALGFRLLHSSTGGKNGGGATLTPEAERFLAAYVGYCREVNDFARARFEDAFAFYIDD
jgi:molybdate transport repressor ModE-like protein